MHVRPGRRRPVAHRAVWIALASVLLAASTVVPVGTVSASSLKDQIDAARHRQAALAKDIGRSQSLLKQLESDQSQTQSALQDTAKQLDGINADQRQVRARIDKAEAALNRAQARHDQLVEDLRQTDYTVGLLEQELSSGEADLKTRRQTLARRLVDAYRVENTSLLEQLLTADSFSDALTETSAYLAYSDQDAEAIAQIATDQRALETLRLLTTATRLQTDQLRRATIDTENEIKARRAELKVQKRKLARLEAKTKRIQARQRERYRTIVHNKKQARIIMRKQAAQERALKARIAGLVRQAQAAASRRAGGGVHPGGGGFFSWPTSGTVTQEYGCTGFYMEPPQGSCAHFHSGIDIANGTGTPVRAAADGVVAFIGYGAGGAWVVVIGHAGGYESLYGHLLVRSTVRSGQFVKKGQLVGYMGCTGWCTGPHLHWEVMLNGSTINPRSVL